MKKSKLVANILIGITVYVIVFLLLGFLFIALPFFIFGNPKTYNAVSMIFSFLPLITYLLIPFSSHFIYYKIMQRFNTKYESSATFKSMFFILFTSVIIVVLASLITSRKAVLIIIIIPLLDAISYLHESKQCDMWIHKEKTERVWTSIKPEIADKMFKMGTAQVSHIIISLSEILNVNLKKCSVDQYKNILNIYVKVFTWKTEKKASYESIILSLQKYNKDYINSEEIAKKVFDFCVSDIYITDYKSKADKTTQNLNEAQNLKNNEFNFCNICGNKLDNDYAFCNKCGNKVR